MDDPEPPWEFKRRRKRLSKADDRQAHLFSAANALCPVEGCGGYMVERKSARGQFLGCSNFPRCRFSRDAMCRSEEHTSELQSLMRSSYAVFCLKKKITVHLTHDNTALHTARTKPKS